MPNFTYSGDPASSNTDRVRFLANDTVDPMRLSDEEIDFLITDTGDPDFAAADAADMIGGKLATKADKSVGPLRIRYREQAQSYFDLANRIRSRAGKVVGGPVLTQTDRDPLFEVGMHDILGGWYPPSRDIYGNWHGVSDGPVDTNDSP